MIPIKTLLLVGVTFSCCFAISKGGNADCLMAILSTSDQNNLAERLEKECKQCLRKMAIDEEEKSIHTFDCDCVYY